MKCNNQYCYWNYEMHCCSESEEAYNNAVPDTLDCPSSLRKDFEEQFYILYNECVALLNKRNMKELREIKEFIESQRQ